MSRTYSFLFAFSLTILPALHAEKVEDVETSKIFPGEVQDLWPKLINSETTASFFSHGMKNNSYSNLQLLGVMIFDARYIGWG